MKRAIFISSVLTFLVLKSYSQSERAMACGRDCSTLSVSLKSDRSCGNSNDYVFTVTNNFQSALSIKIFAEHTDGKWYWLGWGNNIKPGEARSGFWSCSCTGRYIVYYGYTYYTSDAYPSLAEIQRIYGKAQSQYGRNPYSNK
ncbi:MAG: hypothetical protein ACHQF4_09805 [Sphingobacteriales bacterium]